MVNAPEEEVGTPYEGPLTSEQLEKLRISCLDGLLEPLKTYIDEGSFHVDSMFVDGNTALHCACMAPEGLELCRFLLRLGADPNVVARRTLVRPIHLAAAANRREIVGLLLEKDASLTVLESNGYTPLHLAVQSGALDSVKRLLDSGKANLNAVDAAGCTAVDAMVNSPQAASFAHLALGCRFSRLVGDLLDAGLSLEALETESAQGVKPIITCCKNATVGKASIWCAVVDRLIFKGVQFRQLHNNQSPFSVGQDIESEELLSVLVAHCTTKLKVDLSDLGLTHISQALLNVLQATGARSLDLSFNQLRTVPLRLASIMEKVNLEGNPLDLIPMASRSSWAKTVRYLVSLEERAAVWPERKVLFVGEEGVGKSTLMRCFKKKKGRTSCKQNIATDGIQVERNITLTAKASEGPGIVINCWDFGGQEVFYPTHQFFLTANNAYILVFDISAPGVSRLEYWLRQIKLLSKMESNKTKVYLVGTHCDQTSEENVTAVVTHLKTLFRRNVYPSLAGVFPVSCKTGAGISKLRETMLSSFLQDTQSVPLRWVVFYDYVRERSSRQWIGWGEYCRWARLAGISSSDLPKVTRFLGDAGSLIHYGNSEKLPAALPATTTSSSSDMTALTEGQLGHLVVLDPQWLGDVMSSLITVRSNWTVKGILMLENLGRAFSNYPQRIHRMLLGLLVHFRIGYLLRSESAVLLPSLLPPFILKDDSTLWPLKSHNCKEFGRLFRFPFMPVGFFGRVLVQIMHLPELQLQALWRNACVMDFTTKPTSRTSILEGAHRRPSSAELANDFKYRLFLLYDEDGYNLDIRVRQNPANTVGLHTSLAAVAAALRLVVTTIRGQLDGYNMADSVREDAVCNHCLSSDSVGDPFLFPISQAIASVRSGDGILFCRGIRLRSRCVSVLRLAPDLALADLPMLDEAELTKERKIGDGGYGNVYKGTLVVDSQEGSTRKETRVEVAVKEMQPPDVRHSAAQQDKRFTSFQQEAAVMMGLGHRNLVRLYGVVMRPTMQLVMEYMPLGDLFEFLHPDSPLESVKAEAFPWRLRLLMIFDLALGLRSIQSSSPPIVHRDLRTPNLFLKSLSEDPAEVRLKIGDFGLSRVVGKDMSGSLMTWQWLAPEILQSIKLNDTYDERSDIYSFAICAWEIASRQTPYEEYLQDERYSTQGSRSRLFNRTVIIEAISKQGLRPSPPPASEGCPAGLIELIQRCWHTNPSSRPSAEEIVESLCGIIGDPAAFAVAESGARVTAESGQDDGSSFVMPRVKRQRRNVRTCNLLAAMPKSKACALLEAELPGTALPSCALVWRGYLWLGCANGMIYLYDPALKLARFWKAHKSKITAIAVIGDRVWTGGVDGMLRIWSFNSVRNVASLSQEQAPFRKPEEAQSPPILHIAGVKQANGRWSGWLSSGAAETGLLVMNSAGVLEHSVTLEVGVGTVGAIAEVGGLVWVAVGACVFLYDSTAAALRFKLSSHSSRVTCIAYAPSTSTEGLHAWTGDSAGIVVHWDAEREGVKVNASMQAHEGAVSCLGVAYGVLWTASANSVILWDGKMAAVDEIPSPQAVRSFHVLDDTLTAVAASGRLQQFALQEELNEPLIDTGIRPRSSSPIRQPRTPGRGNLGWQACKTNSPTVTPRRRPLATSRAASPFPRPQASVEATSASSERVETQAQQKRDLRDEATEEKAEEPEGPKEDSEGKAVSTGSDAGRPGGESAATGGLCKLRRVATEPLITAMERDAAMQASPSMSRNGSIGRRGLTRPPHPAPSPEVPRRAARPVDRLFELDDMEMEAMGQ